MVSRGSGARPREEAAASNDDWEAQAAAYYQAHLDRVSRSFAFCIPALRQPMKCWVGLAYLLCRVLDTIEDGAWASTEARARCFARFDDFLGGASLGDAALWVQDFPRCITPGERRLVADSERLFRDLSMLPARARDPIVRVGRSMASGMRHFLARRSEGGIVLRDLADLECYCFFVAGVVGEMLTELLCAAGADAAPSRARCVQAHRFGRFLQKVNILKDQTLDRAQGRNLVPSRQAVLESLRGDADAAFEYVTQTPFAERGYRLFCAWGLLLGLDKVRRLGDGAPTSRAETLAFVARVEAQIDDQRGLDSLFRELAAPLPAARSRISEAPPSWFTASYAGVLDHAALSELGFLVPPRSPGSGACSP